MQKKVIFRADGGQQIGLGHIMRSLSLANYLKEEFACSFATTNTDKHIHQLIRQSCKDIIQLPFNQEHYRAFLDQLEGSEIVVLDNYYFSTAYQKQLKDKGCIVVCIDDKQDKHFVADAVINHAEGVAKERYSIEPFTRLLLGFKYALVRPEFINDTACDSNPKIRNILVCIGGSDPLNISKKIAAILVSNSTQYIIHFIIGAAYQYKESLEKVTESEQLKIYSNLSVGEMADLMKKADFGVFPASTVAIEACAARLPFATGYFVDNQHQIYKGLVENELAFDLGNLCTQPQETLAAKLNNYLQNIEKTNFIRWKQREMLDKNVPNRYLEVFKELALQ